MEPYMGNVNDFENYRTVLSISCISGDKKLFDELAVEKKKQGFTRGMFLRHLLELYMEKQENESAMNHDDVSV